MEGVAVILGFEGWARLLTRGVGMKDSMSKGAIRRGEQRVSIRDMNIIITTIQVLTRRHF